MLLRLALGALVSGRQWAEAVHCRGHWYSCLGSQISKTSGLPRATKDWSPDPHRATRANLTKEVTGSQGETTVRAALANATHTLGTPFTEDISGNVSIHSCYGRLPVLVRFTRRQIPRKKGVDSRTGDTS
jgi:hypothetical protein